MSPSTRIPDTVTWNVPPTLISFSALAAAPCSIADTTSGAAITSTAGLSRFVVRARQTSTS